MKTLFPYVLIIIFVGMLFQSFNIYTTNCYEENSRIKIYPENPKVGDEIFILEEICSYELLNPLIIIGNTITYTRHFNFNTKQCCFPMIDTVSLGHLEEGHYTIKYMVINDSYSESDSSHLLDTFNFNVTVE